MTNKIDRSLFTDAFGSKLPPASDRLTTELRSSVILSPVYMSSKIYDDISSLIKKSYPNSCILYIDEVMNPGLLHNYLNKKHELENLRGIENIKELQLFHGTNHRNINSIALCGFQTKYNKTSAYGIGTYFATNAMYSVNYTNINNDISYMFLCDVLIGVLTNVTHNCIIDTNKYDNSVNSLVNPTIYVTPYDNSAYPKYLIAFHKNAT